MSKMKRKILNFGEKTVALILCFTMVFGPLPTITQAEVKADKSYTRLYDFDEAASTYLTGEGNAVEEYPNGAFMFPLANAQLEMDDLYAIEVFRQGGTEGEASITVKTVDLTAEYGNDYEIFLDNGIASDPVAGQANPYYDMEEYSFLATYTQKQVEAASNQDENVDQIRQDASAYNDYVLDEAMPVSSEFTLQFADGENSRTIFIQTHKRDEVSANLEFTLNLCHPEGGSLGVQTSCAMTILERREIPSTYLTLQETKVNPESEEAYIVVKRSGNMGTKGTFTVRTESGSAKAGEAYQAVQMPLEFLPGMSEIEIPVTMLDGAENDTYFTANLEDITVAQSESQQAKVTITKAVPQESKHESAFTVTYAASSLVTSNTGVRGVQIIDASDFSVSAYTDRGTGSQGHGYNTNGTDRKLEYWNNWSSSNNGISVRSNEKINFTGVDSISMATDNYTGSTSCSHQVIYVADKDKLTNSTSDFDFIYNLDGIGGCWDMTDIADSFIVHTADLDQKKVKGEHYLFIMCHHGALVGYAGYNIYNRGSENPDMVDHNIRMLMTKYNISIIEPASTPVYVDGTLVNTQVAKNHQLVDPAALKDNDTNKGTAFDIYRDETTAISSVIDSQFNGLVKLEGVYFCESGKTEHHSELYKLDSDSFTLTAEILETYEDFIKDKKIVIQPVYTVSDSHLTVESFDNTATGQKFVADNENCSGEFYYNDQHIGTLTWTKPRENGNYLVADQLKFTFEYAQDTPEKYWNLKFDTRAAATEEMLSSAAIVTVDNGTFSADLQLSDVYFSVTPNFSLANTTTQLNVTNPGNGGFIGKGGKYATTNSDGSVTLTGYSAEDGATDTIFTNMSVDEIITFSAQPNAGYRAKWTYTDSASHSKKVYYGNSFFFAIQNPYYVDDNHVTLTFEKTGNNVQTFNFSGQTLLQEGSVINPPTSHSDTYNLVSGAQVTMDSYSALSDLNGEFTLETDPGEEDSQPVKISAAADEVHRALVFYNNQYFIVDIDMAQYLSSGSVTSVNAQLKMNYKTHGVAPVSIQALASDGTHYGDTITLITAVAVQFDLVINTKGQDAEKPVNLVRWSIENEDGVKSSYDVELEKGATVSHWANTLSEIMKQGDKLYVELMWKGYDDDANEIYSSYGKYDTGYKFIATSVLDTITYAPDIGAPATLSKPIPVLGPVSPTFSIKGFTPIINQGTAGTDKDGHEIQTITIGVSYGRAKNFASKDGDWGTSSAKKNIESIQNVLSNFDKANNSLDGLPKKAVGSSLANALNMKTAVKLSFSVTVCYQGNYYVDNNSGEWMFVGNLLIVGAGGTIRVSIPFVLCYIPCFAYFTASVNVNVYMGIFAHTDEETGSTVALSLDQLEDAEASTFQGVYEVQISLGAGVGVGFDGLLSASGGVDFTFDIEFNDFMRGYGTVAMKGSITLELLFLKASWSEQFFKEEMFNTLADADALMDTQLLLSQVEEDLLKNTTIGDMSVLTAKKSNLLMGQRIAGGEETVALATETFVDPEIISIGGGKYFVVSTFTDDENSLDNVLHYYIYDETTNEITEEAPVLKKAADEIRLDQEAQDAWNELTEDYTKIDHSAVMADCGEDILIAWNKSMIPREGSDNKDLLSAVGIATIYYNKQTGKFHDYSVIVDTSEKFIYMTPKVAYNNATDTAQVFYQAMSVEGLTLDTTLEELYSKPTALMTSYVSVKEGAGQWSESSPVAINGEYLKYFDATSYEDTIMLAYVASNTVGFTLDSTDGFEKEDSFDDTQFDTKNAMYIQQFNEENGNLTSTNPIRITKDGYVTANPKFIEVSRDNIENTLLFYKCNGRYGYQNITNILTNALYTDAGDRFEISDSYAEPQCISDEEDYTVNDDFTVYGNANGNIYALWTTSESNCQQIWAKQFVLNNIEKVTETGKLDEEGVLLYDESGNPILEPLETPIYLLNGTWGGKTYLTEEGILGNSNIGRYKNNFAAAVLEDGRLLTVFNAFDREITEDSCDYINNMLVMGEYDASPDYQMPEVIDAIEFSNDYPTKGETVNVTCHAQNMGVDAGRNVTVTLYVNGQKYDSTTEKIWVGAEAKSFDFYYTMPDDVKADTISMYYTITEDGREQLRSDTFSLKDGAVPDITMVVISPVRLITDENDQAKFLIKATVENIGNEPYTGGDYIRLVDFDVEEMCLAMKDDYEVGAPIYTSLGRQKIEPIEIGHTSEVIFVSDDVPAAVFEKTGTDTAYLECIISGQNEADWTTRNAEEEFMTISEFYPGLTKKPVPETAQSITLSNITMQVGQQQKMDKNVQPVSALIYSDVTYTSSDESVVSVDSSGIVTGKKEGTAVITAEVDGLTAEAQVIVTAASHSDVPDVTPGETETPDKQHGADDGNTADQVNTGDTEMSLIFLLLLASAVIVVYVTRRKVHWYKNQ